VPLRRGMTVYTRWGNWFVYACLAAGTAVVGAAARRSQRAQ
jgi:apolipoprotein N-acyltransferase